MLGDRAAHPVIAPAQAYASAITMLCKYADMSTAVRNGIFIQGIVLLSGIGFLMSRSEYLVSFFSAIFTFALTFILSLMHRHYNDYFFSVRGYIKYLETTYNVPGMVGYVSYVEGNRDTRVEVPAFGWLKLYGPFVLIGGASLVLIVINMVMSFIRKDLDAYGSIQRLFGLCSCLSV